jgi:16S rRNA (cytosine967-C5)-methyltransferase
MPDRKTPSTPTRLDKPLLRLETSGRASKPQPSDNSENRASKVPPSRQPASKNDANRPRRNTADAAGKGKAKSFDKSSGKSSGKAGQEPSRKPAAKKPDAAAKKPTPPSLASRRIVYDLLIAVDEGVQLDKALSSNPDLPKLEDRDRRFVRLLATTSLRHRGQLEKVLAPLVSRKPFGAQANANFVLLMGAAQILLLKTGAHAAVDSTVELMRQTGFDRLCGLANAVMRRLTREGEALFDATSHMDNLPGWLQQSWRHYWGVEKATAIAGLAMLPPPLDISVKADAEGWAAKLEARVIDHHTLRREFDGDPSLLAGFEDGAWWVQDAAAALPARLLGEITDKDVIDLCAAPGGKTAQLIAAGAKVTAIDNSRKRLDRLRRNLKRLKLPATLVLADGAAYTPEIPVDAVLVDAPCSATGTVRRRPDILNQREAEDIVALQQIQWNLATTALGWLRAGGRMVYATCSLQPEEGEDIIDAVMDAAEGRFAIDPVTPEEAGIFARSITDQGYVRILPSDYEDIGGVDGFFIARLISLG